MRNRQTSRVFEVEYFEKGIFCGVRSYNTKSTYVTTSGIPPHKYEITSVMVPAIPDFNIDLSNLGPMEKKEFEAGSVFGRSLGQRKGGRHSASEKELRNGKRGDKLWKEMHTFSCFSQLS